MPRPRRPREIEVVMKLRVTGETSNRAITDFLKKEAFAMCGAYHPEEEEFYIREDVEILKVTSRKVEQS